MKTALFLLLLFSVACNPPQDNGDSTNTGDGDTDGDADTEPLYTGPLQGLDVLVVIDNSSSMAQEQAILGNALFALVQTLRSGPAADLRLAFTTTDMGLQWGGNPIDPEDDGWPDNALPIGCENPLGNNGAFLTDYADAATTVGDLQRDCPASPDSLEQLFLSAEHWTGDDLALAASCMADPGIEGCGFEQQLIAAVKGLSGDGIATGFLRPEALLLVLVVSDEEDASLDDGPDLFATDEMVNMYERNIAVGHHPEYLYTPAEVKQMMLDAKAQVSGAIRAGGSVMFAAITGVPHEGEGATACQGSGTDVAACLDVALEEGTMGEPETITRIPASGGTIEAAYFEYACERRDGDVPITQAFPGTRFVALAQLFGDMGYVYSICNEDWRPAMNAIASRVEERLRTTSR